MISEDSSSTLHVTTVCGTGPPAALGRAGPEEGTAQHPGGQGGWWSECTAHSKEQELRSRTVTTQNSTNLKVKIAFSRQETRNPLILPNSKLPPLFEHIVLTIQPVGAWTSSTLRTQKAGLTISSCLGRCVAHVPQLAGQTGLHPAPLVALSPATLSAPALIHTAGSSHVWLLNRNQIFTSFNFH